MCLSGKTLLSRRRFLKLVTAGTCAGLGNYLITPARDFLAFGAIGTGRRIVFIHMAGGWSLNCAPAGHGTYVDKMTPIYPTSTLAIGSGDQFLHPAFVNLHTHYQAGRMLVINKVRDMNYSRSHEDATVRYLSGLSVTSTNVTAEAGIGARIGCLEASNPLAAVSFSGSDTWSAGNCNPALDISSLDNLGETPLSWSNQRHKHFTTARDSIMAAEVVKNEKRQMFVRTAANSVALTMDTLRQFQNVNTGVTFPGSGIGNSLRNIAQVIIGQQSSPLRTAAFLCSQGGYDTHSGKVNSLNQNLGALDAAIHAFLQAMQANGLLNDVAVICFGEFGRTFCNTRASGAPNGGTDHGASQRVFVLGGRVNGGRYANAPETPAECNGQYLTAYDFDFRSIFRQFVEGGLGIAGSAIFPEAIPAGDNDAAIFRA